jgi:hypothetical protein
MSHDTFCLAIGFIFGVLVGACAMAVWWSLV